MDTAMKLKNKFLGVVLGLAVAAPSLRGEGFEWSLRPKPIGIAGAKALEFPNGNTFIHLPVVAGEDFILNLEPQMSANQVMEALLAVYAAKHGFAANISLSLPREGVELPEGLQTEMFSEFMGQAGAQRLCINDTACLELAAPKRTITPLPRFAKSYVIDDAELADGLDAENLVWPPKMSEMHGQLVFVLLRGTDNATLLKTLARIRMLRNAGAYVHLIAPYLPYARSDKAEREVGATAQGRLVADMIQIAGANALTTVRAHAPQSIGFFDIPVIEVHGRATINAYLETLAIDAVVSPDAGFQKDAAHYARELGVDVIVFQKERDSFGNSRVLGSISAGLQGKRLALIDDETASGNTLGEVAKCLKEAGAAKVYAVVTHLAGDARGVRQSPYVDQLVVTDTLRNYFVADDKINVLGIAKELVAGIKRSFPLPTMAKVGVGSTNPDKVSAVLGAVRAKVGEAVAVSSEAVESMVKNQPIEVQEAGLGVENRLQAMSEKNFAVAIENYVAQEEGTWYDQPLVGVAGAGRVHNIKMLGMRVAVPTDLVERSLASGQNLTVGHFISESYADKGEVVNEKDWHSHPDFAGRSRRDIMEEAVFHSLYADKLINLRNKVRLVEDFPKPGILFEDISPILADQRAFGDMIDILADRYRNEDIDSVAGLDARGFIIAGALATKLKLGLIMIRKKDKLPPPVIEESYAKEYGLDSVAVVDNDDIKGKRVLVVDDLIATGGSAKAAVNLLRRSGANVVAFASLLEIPALAGRGKLDVKTFNLIPVKEAFVAQ